MSELLQTLHENTTFLLTVVLVFAALCLTAKILEHALCRDAVKSTDARYLAVCAMCAALAGLLMLLEIPLFFVPSFYKIDLSELPVLFCGFYLGPVAGVVCEFLKVLIKLLLKGTTSAFVGEFANFAVGCSMVLPAAVIYHCHKTKRGAVIALVIGTLIMTVFGSLFNALYLLPQFALLYGLPLDSIVEMGNAVNPAVTNVTTLVVFAVAPLNLLKGTVVSLLTFALYKRVERVLFRAPRRK